MRHVMADLEGAGVGLEAELRTELEADPIRPWSVVDFGSSSLAMRRGLEFWSLIGDASQQQGTSRLVDASTSRVEVALRRTAAGDDRPLGALRLRANGIDLPLRAESDARGPVRVFGVRYRSFVPTVGLHPTLGAQTPVHLVLVDPERDEAVEIALHEWRPDGEGYDGVPANLSQAAARRAARCVARTVGASDLPPAREAPRGALSAYSLDLRYG